MGLLTVIPADRVTNEGSGPNTDRHEQTGDYGSDNANDHNGMLLARGIGINDHCGGRGGL